MAVIGGILTAVLLSGLDMLSCDTEDAGAELVLMRQLLDERREGPFISRS